MTRNGRRRLSSSWLFLDHGTSATTNVWWIIGHAVAAGLCLSGALEQFISGQAIGAVPPLVFAGLNAFCVMRRMNSHG